MVVTNATMPLNQRLVDADDDEDALYGILVALMLLLPDAVRDTSPADVLQSNGYCHKDALNTLRMNDLEEMGVLRGHARMMMNVLRVMRFGTHDLVSYI